MKMTKKIIASILLLSIVLLSVTYFYKIIFIAILLYYWRSNFKSKRLFRSLFIVALLGIYFVTPDYFYREGRRIKVITLDSKGERATTPLLPYVMSVVAPEAELNNIVQKLALPLLSLSEIAKSNWIVTEMIENYKDGNADDFVDPYRDLENSGYFLPSIASNQLLQQVGINRNLDSFYLIKPKYEDPNKKYPLVVFAHGYLGNWLLYQNFLSELEDCYVMSVGTIGLDGFFSIADMDRVVNTNMKYVISNNLNIDKSRCALLGLSNGGTAVNTAINNYSAHFNTFGVISTSLNVKPRSRSKKLILIGGAKDQSSGKQPAMYRSLKAGGYKAESLWMKDSGHLLLVNQKDTIVEFLSKEL